MPNPNDNDSLLIQEFHVESIEAIIRKRQQLVDKALASGDIDTLNTIALIDKQNRDWLQAEKDDIKKQLQNVDKIKQYVE